MRFCGFRLEVHKTESICGVWGRREADINIDTCSNYNSRLVNPSVLTAHPFKSTFSKRILPLTNKNSV